MSNLKAKLKKQGGFTMVELLIVVAIIGILAAVSIPMFNNALEKARHGVDAANIRDAVSLGNAEIIASLDPKVEFGKEVNGNGGKGVQTYTYVVNNESADPNEHQGYLASGADVTGGVTVQCTGTNAPEDSLQVKIFYDPGAGDGKEYQVCANWKINTDGHIIVNGDFDTFGN